MLSAFFGLNIARKALQSNQLAQDVVAHNIANANHPNFRRQRANFSAAFPIGFPALNKIVGPGQFGSGVDISTVQQIRDQFLETRLDREKQGLKQWEQLEAVLSQVEAVFQATEQGDLNDLIHDFFSAFDDLSKSPESLAERQNVVARGQALARAMNFIYERLVRLQEDANQSIELEVNEVNEKLREVARINELIRKIEADGDRANDLRDKRDGLISEVAELMDISTMETEFGDKTVYINEQVLVQNHIFRPLEAVADPQNPKKLKVQFQDSKQPVTILGGKLYANILARDTAIPFYLDKLNELATRLAVEVNALHSSGYGLADHLGQPFTGDNFFVFDPLKTQTTNVSEATYSATVQGIVQLPEGTTEDTTLDQLGVTEGKFIIDGQTITLAAADVTAGTALSLRQLFDKIEDAVPGATASLNTANRKVIITKKDGRSLTIQSDTTNFPPQPPFSNFTSRVVTGLDTVIPSPTVLPDQRSAVATVSTDDAAARIQVNPDLIHNLNRIAAAQQGRRGANPQVFPGDGSNALAIAKLQQAKTMGETEKLDTFQSFFAGLVTQLGLDVQEASRQVESFDLNVQVLKARRDAVSGVNLDEELANMVKFQQAYNAAARIFRTMDEMLQVLVNLGAG